MEDDKSPRINMDFESYSKADIKVVGSGRYAMDPSTDIICLAYAFNDEEPRLWNQTFHRRLTCLSESRPDT